MAGKRRGRMNRSRVINNSWMVQQGAKLPKPSSASRPKKLNLFPAEPDLSPDSRDFYPIVDLHYITHLVEDNGGRATDAADYGSYFQELKNGKNTPLVTRLMIEDDSGPNVKNYSMARSLVLAERFGHLPYVERIKKVSSVIHDHGVRCIRNRSENGAAEEFYRRAFSVGVGIKNNRLFQILLFPFVGRFRWVREKLYNHTPHMALQWRFNEQTRRSARSHRSLEDVLSTSDLTMPEQYHRFEKAAHDIDYDMALFDGLSTEIDFFKRALPALWLDPGKGSDALAGYGDLLAQRRTTADLVRTITLQYISDVVRDARGWHDEEQNKYVRTLIADQFLQNIDVSHYLTKAIGMYDPAAIHSLLERKPSLFGEAYTAALPHIEGILGLQSQLQKLRQRARQADIGENPEFLRQFIGDSGAFVKALEFDRAYGSLDDPWAASTLHQKCASNLYTYRRIKGLLDRSSIDAWVAVDNAGLLDTALDLSDAEFKAAVSILRENTENGITALRFASEYDAIVRELEKPATKQAARIQVPPRRNLLESRDHEKMADFLSYVAGIELKREQQEWRHALRLRVGDNEEIRQLIEGNYAFVKCHLQELREIRKELFNRGEESEYALAIHRLAAASPDKIEEALTAIYVDVTSSRLQQPAAAPKRWSRKKAGQEKAAPADHRPAISHVILVGARPGTDYGKRLAPHYDIGQLTTVDAAAPRRLRSAGDDAVYVVITDSISHSLSYAAGAYGARVAHSPTSGARNLVAAIRQAMM